MRYTAEFKPRAIKDLRPIPAAQRERLLNRIEQLQDGLGGDVKQLTNHEPQYRMRAGNWRVLFEVEGHRIIIYRIRHRREAYR